MLHNIIPVMAVYHVTVGFELVHMWSYPTFGVLALAFWMYITAVLYLVVAIVGFKSPEIKRSNINILQLRAAYGFEQYSIVGLTLML